jgi:hypothetical protein
MNLKIILTIPNIHNNSYKEIAEVLGSGGV